MLTQKIMDLFFKEINFCPKKISFEDLKTTDIKINIKFKFSH